jgi:glycosyltransferase involved in cell wall biosynthesis
MGAIKVFHLITGLEVGGAEKTLLEVLPRLDQSRFRSSVWSVTSVGPVGESLRQQGFPVEALGFRLSRAPIAAARLIRALRRERPVILHAHMTHANIAARLVSRVVRPPVVICAERNSGVWKSSRLVHFERWIAGWADWYTAVSASVADFLVEQQGVPPGRVSVIRNGVAMRRPLPAERRTAVRNGLGLGEGQKLVLSVGRVVPQKGYEHLIRAAPAVLDRVPEARFFVAGDTSRAKYADYRAGLAETAADLGVSEAVRFLGVRDDVPELLGSADLFVMPSLWEGLPNALLEAMASGLPAVTTAVNGAGEVASMARTAVPVPPGDPEALASAVIQLLEDSVDAQERAAAGLELVKREFTWARTASSLASLYERLSSDRQPR